MGLLDSLFDTNILIDYLKGVPFAIAEIHRPASRAISVISWMEVMAGSPSEADPVTRRFLNKFQLLPIKDAIIEQAVVKRRLKRLKLPDAIILARRPRLNIECSSPAIPGTSRPINQASASPIASEANTECSS